MGLFPASAMLLAAWIGYGCLPRVAAAAETTSTAGTGLERPSDYDPFVTTATDADPIERADSGRTDDYDPFEALPPKKGGQAPLSVRGSRDFRGGSGASPRFSTAYAIQESGPSLAESLPAPTMVGPPAEADSATDAAWMPKPLGELSTTIRLPSGMLPRDYSAERPPVGLPYWDPCGAVRGWPLTCYHWQASCFCHNPLYFEEINLERYGYGCGGCLQYGVSAAHFFATVPALPYLMAVDCPWECDYTLGHYRPGSCPPWRYHWPRCCDPSHPTRH